MQKSRLSCLFGTKRFKIFMFSLCAYYCCNITITGPRCQDKNEVQEFWTSVLILVSYGEIFVLDDSKVIDY
jgi:hypothetical protein